MLYFQSSRLFAQLDEFSEQHGISAAGLKNVFKSLLTIPNSTYQCVCVCVCVCVCLCLCLCVPVSMTILLPRINLSIGDANFCFDLGGLRMNLGPSQMKDDLINLGLNEERAQYFSEQVSTAPTKMRNANDVLVVQLNECMIVGTHCCDQLLPSEYSVTFNLLKVRNK